MMASRNLGAAIAACGLMIVLPGFLSPFWLTQIAIQSLCLGMVAASLSFLMRYSGQLSLAQTSVAGVASYALAYLGPNDVNLGPGWSMVAAVPAAFVISILYSGAVGTLAARTRGVNCLMITLAIGMSVFYLARQNYSIFGGFRGISIGHPQLLGLAFNDGIPFYYLCLAIVIVSCVLVAYLEETPLGLALRAVGSSPERTEADGYSVGVLKVVAAMLAGALASCGGILLLWYHARISPGAIGVSSIIGTLIVAVLGGIQRPINAFLGAFLYVLLDNYAIDLAGSERFQTLVGSIFLAVVVLSPNGVAGLLVWPRDGTKALARVKHCRCAARKERIGGPSSIGQ
ncbi:branched-chain amino acid ABC transporter permease [Bradyrhizobium jicamae]|uniref:branched-chain amino acid ABC transporter permease n=1 Tax=Bradyrhizobium jicamae TaxID=280332 RepID=UPI001BAAB4F5|nr:branched-chain amino acid ABC transporter permease [Bradyrhizobium jicamae]MBR0934123.1 branched-chain amino acid ABC transporter permease [Bradyrhizobium jicamae]